MAAAAICSASFGNLGAMCEAGNGLAAPTGIILTTDTFEFTDGASFGTLADWETGVKNLQVFPLMGIQETEDNTEETVYYDSPLGNKVLLRNGKYIYKFNFLLGLKQHIELQKFSSAKLRYFIVDDSNKIRGYSPDGTAIKGFSISNFEAEKMKAATTDSPAFSPISIVEQNSTQWNGFGVDITPTWEAESLTSLTNVDIAVVGSPTSSVVVVSVGYKTGLASDGSDEMVAIKGLVAADFTLLKADGSTQTITTLTDNADGTYDLNGTGYVTGTVDIVAPETLTSDILIASTGSAVVTVP